MPSIYFIRHGQADHNVGYKTYGDPAYDMPCYWNASLTDHGVEEARQLRNHAGLQSLVNPRIIVSPLQRTLETAAEIFPGRLFEIDDIVTEFNPAWRCNRRVGLATLKDEWPEYEIRCAEKTPTAEETWDQLIVRVNAFVDSVRDSQQPIVVITHHDFLSAMLDVLKVTWEGKPKIHHCSPITVEL
jgi:broad specificity phosphatase PhoE